MSKDISGVSEGAGAVRTGPGAVRGIFNCTLREKLAQTGPVGPRWERILLDRAEASDMAVWQERARLLALSLRDGS